MPCFSLLTLQLWKKLQLVSKPQFFNISITCRDLDLWVRWPKHTYSEMQWPKVLVCYIWGCYCCNFPSHNFFGIKMGIFWHFQQLPWPWPSGEIFQNGMFRKVFSHTPPPTSRTKLHNPRFHSLREKSPTLKFSTDGWTDTRTDDAT